MNDTATQVSDRNPSSMDTDALSFAVVYTYAFVVPLGTLARIGDDHRSLGVGTLLLMFFLCIRINGILRMCGTSKTLFLLAAFFLYTTFATAASLHHAGEEQFFKAIVNQAQLFAYFGLAAGLASMPWTLQHVRSMASWLALGVLIAASLTLIDAYTGIDVPRVNDGMYATVIDGGKGVLQLHGPYGHRTTMAMYLGTIAPFLLISGTLVGLSSGMRILLVSAGVLSTLLLLLSHNRSAPLAMALVMGALLFRNAAHLWRLALAGVIGIAVLGYVVYSLVPETVEAYRSLFLHFLVEGEGGAVSKSDSQRWVLAKAVAANLLDYPHGIGFTDVYSEEYGWDDPHSIYASMLNAGGFVAILFLIALGVRLVLNARKLRATDTAMFLSLAVPLGVWAIIGLMHNVIYAALGWVFLGIWFATETPRTSPAIQRTP